MMPYHSYQQWEIERAHTLAEQRAADRRRGEAIAAMSGSIRRLRRLRLRLHVQRPITPPAVVDRVPPRARAAGAPCTTEA